MGRGGARLGLPPEPALTPREYAVVLAAELRVRAEQTRRWRDRWTGLAQQGGTAMDHLAALYTLYVYGGGRTTVTDEDEAREAWGRLRRPLFWFRWLGWTQWISRGRVAVSRRPYAFGALGGTRDEERW